MLPYKSLIQLDKRANTPLYLQICNEFIKRITDGTIQPGLKLPGSRQLASWLIINRRTVISAFEELEAQGWIEVMPNRGSFVSSKLPQLIARPISVGGRITHKNQSHFSWEDKLDFLSYYDPPQAEHIHLVVDAGYPDVRLSPVQELSRNLGSIVRSKRQISLMKYSNSFRGDVKLREEIIKDLAETRSIHIGLDNIFISRGSLMAFTLIFQVLLEKGDAVIVGDVSFQVANNIIQIAQGELVKVPIDSSGIDVEAIEKVCQQRPIKAVFIMPHHHNPTTVSLVAERRMKLLMLAEQYHFAIIEDDYDYDFHYASSPILPLASSDQIGSVVYVGSLSKTIAPSLRIGYIVGPKDLIDDITRLSRFMDCHGNIALERAIAMLYKEGEIKRYLKKALRVYQERRDLFCRLLKDAFGEEVSFNIPEGGLALWVNFSARFPLIEVREKALAKGLQIPKPVFSKPDGSSINAIRMGFASLNPFEIEAAINLLKEVAFSIPSPRN